VASGFVLHMDSYDLHATRFVDTNELESLFYSLLFFSRVMAVSFPVSEVGGAISYISVSVDSKSETTETDRRSAVYFRMRTASIQRVSVTRSVDALGQLESNHPSCVILLQRCNNFHGRSSIFQFP
jgi:hypothetical protein